MRTPRGNGERRTEAPRGEGGGFVVPESLRVASAAVLVAAAFAAGHVVRAVTSSAGRPADVQSPPATVPAAQPETIERALTPSSPAPAPPVVGATLSALVRTDAGAPVPRVRVRWLASEGDDDDAHVLADAETGDDGRVAIDGAVPRAVDLLVRLPAGFAAAPEPPPAPERTRRGPVESDRKCRLDVVLPDGTTTSHYRAVVTHGSGASGMSRSPSGDRWISSTGTLWVVAGEREEYVAGPIRLRAPLPRRLRVEVRRLDGQSIDLVPAEGFEWLPLSVRVVNADGAEVEPDGRPQEVDSFGDPVPPGVIAVVPGEYDVGASHDGVAWDLQKIRVGASPEPVRLVAPPPDPRSLVLVEVLGPDGERCDAEFRWKASLPNSSFERGALSRREEDGRHLVFRGDEPGPKSRSARRWLEEAEWTLFVDAGAGPFEAPVPLADREITVRTPVERTLAVRVEGPGTLDLGGAKLEVRCDRKSFGRIHENGANVKVWKVADDGTATAGPLHDGTWHFALFSQRSAEPRILATKEVVVGEDSTSVTFHVPKLHSLRVVTFPGDERQISVRPADCDWETGTTVGLDSSGTTILAGLTEGRHEVLLVDRSSGGWSRGTTRIVSIPETEELRWE